MIRAVDYQRLDMADEEYAYYQELIKNLSTDQTSGDIFFRDLFKSDEKGIITIIKPIKPVPWEVMFFMQNLMINQHLREQDARIDKLEMDGPK